MAQTRHLHFLVIKHGALGDIIQGLDAYAALRQSFPEAHITLLTSRPFAPLMAEMPFFDEIIIDKRAPSWQLSALYSLRTLFQRSFDYIIDLQCCGGTHCLSTKELGSVEIGKIENKGKRNRRVNIRFKND